MIRSDELLSRLSEIANIVVDGDETRVTTHCLYPTNALVRVALRAGNETVVVSDMGGALREASSAGLEVGVHERAVKAIVRDQGLRFADGVIYSPSVKMADVAGAIVLVANASRDVASWCFSKFKVRTPRNFKQALSDLLKGQFRAELKSEYPFRGKSTKQYRFDYALLVNGRTILIDGATPDAASINSRVVANLDVRQAGYENVDQYVVYDDDVPWQQSDLLLLNIAAHAVPFSRAAPVVSGWGSAL